MNRRSIFVLVLVAAGVGACSRPYRIGDKVLVEWGEERLLYPAFIIEIKGKSRYRVHYDGYPSRWDEDVELPRIQGHVTSDVPPPPPPLKVRVARGLGTNDAADTPGESHSKRAIAYVFVGGSRSIAPSFLRWFLPRISWFTTRGMSRLGTKLSQFLGLFPGVSVKKKPKSPDFVPFGTESMLKDCRG